MKHSDEFLDDTAACCVARTLDIIGERWSLLILRDLLVGMTRYDEIARDLGIASNVLALRLQTLVEHGVVSKTVNAEDARAFDYALTAKGRELYPVLLALTAWGNKWFAELGQQPLLVVHATCGHITAAVPSMPIFTACTITSANSTSICRRIVGDFTSFGDSNSIVQIL